MDAQGFGSTMTSGFFNQTSTSSFAPGASFHGGRPQSAYMSKADLGQGDQLPGGSANPLMTEGGDDLDEEERRQ